MHKKNFDKLIDEEQYSKKDSDLILNQRLKKYKKNPELSQQDDFMRDEMGILNNLLIKLLPKICVLCQKL